MEIQGVLYVDPQAARPAGFCEICGGEVYWPGALVLPVRKEGEECTCGN